MFQITASIGSMKITDTKAPTLREDHVRQRLLANVVKETSAGSAGAMGGSIGMGACTVTHDCPFA